MRLWSWVSSHDRMPYLLFRKWRRGSSVAVGSTPGSGAVRNDSVLMAQSSSADGAARAGLGYRGGLPGGHHPGKRLDEGDESVQLLLGDLALEGGHQRLEAGHQLGPRVEDRLAEVVVVGHHH